MTCCKSYMHPNGIQEYAYVGNEQIHINDYVGQEIKCKMGHELIPVKGNKYRNHFRHKNGDNLPKISDWHLEWQSKFKKTEVCFNKVEGQIKDRRADAVEDDIAYEFVYEFQHSDITIEEVNNRVHDYKLHNKKVIWIIDGYKTKIKYRGETTFIEFTTEWNYKSFLSQAIILIDIEKTLYKVYPDKVKSNMIDVEPANDYKDIAINYLQQCTLKIKQQGAGNGKTYGIINKLSSDEFNPYKYYIIVTKQHSAKDIIKKEAEDQMNNTIEKYGNHYKIIDGKKTIIISTIDSLMYSLGDGNRFRPCKDKFEKIVNDIVDGCIIEKNDFKHAGVNLKLNKEVLLIVDETQDLPIDYGEAIYEIMRCKYVDAYIVGDKLQSISYEVNAFTHLLEKELSYINKIPCEKINICRRFGSSILVNFINSVVDFDKYDLPRVSVSEEKEGEVNFIKQCKKDEDTIDNIMYYYKKEVDEHDYEPNEFLIVTPYVRKNDLVSALENAITLFWTKRRGPDNSYNRYAVFHKSQDGCSIKTEESEYATRMVSIHTSKGDGRKVVFVVGVTESILKCFSGSINLIYESMLHVAITRQKKTLYFVVNENNDNIHRRLTSLGSGFIRPCIKISNKVCYNRLIGMVKDISTLNIPEKTFERDEHELIDMGHHVIRYASCITSFIIKACNKGLDENIVKQYYAMLRESMNLPIKETDVSKVYNNSLRRSDEAGNPIKPDGLYLLVISNGAIYKRYFNIIKSTIINVRSKLTLILRRNNLTLCPYECIVLYFMLETLKCGLYADISIKELYHITHVYNNSFNKIGHDNCKCFEYFNNKVSSDDEDEYLKKHYEQMQKINNEFDNFLDPNITWLYQHRIKLIRKNENYKVDKWIQLIGHNQENVYLVYIKPQFNDLNYYEIMTKAVFDTYLVKNITDKQEENYKRFGNKRIITVVFSTNGSKYMSELNSDVTELIKEKLLKHYLDESNQLKQFYEYYYNMYKNENNILSKIIIAYNESKDEHLISPDFVKTFFDAIQKEIDDADDNGTEPNLVRFINYNFTRLVTRSIDNYM
jgi:hypothetical protein